MKTDGCVKLQDEPCDRKTGNLDAVICYVQSNSERYVLLPAKNGKVF